MPDTSPPPLAELLAEPVITTLPLDRVRPYWRNPRRIPDAAVEAVRHSIETYGYITPIVVDTDHVIIAGHTRAAALRRLGATYVPVIVATLTPEQAKAYRLIDNKSGEFTSWDHDTLVQELRELDAIVAGTYFPTVDLADEIADSISQVTNEDVARADKAFHDIGPAPKAARPTIEVQCPHCFQSIIVDRETL